MKLLSKQKAGLKKLKKVRPGVRSPLLCLLSLCASLGLMHSQHRFSRSSCPTTNRSATSNSPLKPSTRSCAATARMRMRAKGSEREALVSISQASVRIPLSLLCRLPLGNLSLYYYPSRASIHRIQNETAGERDAISEHSRAQDEPSWSKLSYQIQLAIAYSHTVVVSPILPQW